jgi:hypothetical protein
MRVVDKTPLQDAQGNISLTARIQGTLKYGFNWYSELEAQKSVIAQLDRTLDKGFVLIRNFILPGSEIVLPILLIGPGSISLIFVTPLKGHFEAKGDQWNIINDRGNSVPARRNLVDLTSKLVRVFKKYLSNHRINVSVPIEPVLISSNPGAQIESHQPVVRVVRSDAVKQFASSLNQMRAVMRADMVIDLAEEILEPRPRQEPMPEAAERPVSRAQAIFNASNEMSTATGSDAEPSEKPRVRSSQAVPGHLRETSPARPLPSQSPTRRRFLGMTRNQIFMLGAMILIQVCIVIGGIALILSLNT